MRRSFTYLVLIAFTMLNALSVVAQNVITISGSVVNGKTKEKLPAVSVSIKGSTTGTFTDADGNFKFTTSQKLPLTLVITSIGYATKEVTVASDKTPVSVELETSFLIGQDVVVAASRTPERILESPVSIERVGPAAIRNAPAASYYDLVGNLKGVDVVTSSLTFKTPTTRGFSGSGNLRMNQFVDGMDNQAPGLNFSVGGFIGLTELDVESMELLPGASSALYGTGGMNGTLLINSKSPFKYQGLSFQVKQGVMHVDRAQRNTSPFHDWSVRWGKKVSEKFAFKIGAQFIQARDWIANDERNFLRPPFSANQNGEVKAGNRGSDPNYDGVNVYGDETTQNLNTIYASVLSSVPGALLGASNAFLNAQPNATIAQYNAFLTSIGAGALVNGGLSPILYGGHPTKNYFNGVDVSRTGYSEVNVISPTTVNIRLQGGLYYKIKENLELSGVAFWGTGNTVYTGLDRYALQNLKMGQYKLELKGKDFFVRGYTIQENSGESFNATIVSRLFNERWKPSQTWYPQYMSAYATALASGVPSVAAHQGARAFADQGRPTGNIYETQTFRNIANTPISRGGGLFLDRSDLYVAEAQYNLTNLLGLKDKGTDILVGGNFRQFQLNSQGTLFADTAGAIKINEYGFYGQVQQKLFKDRLKLSVSGRYDKNENFEGRFTPRVSAVVKVAENHNVRMSYQTAYRFPSTQNQWINLVVGGGTYLIGGLPQLRQFYNFSGNPVYSQANVQQFATAFLTNLAQQGVSNPANATPAQIGAALGASGNILQPYQFREFKPEVCTSYEIGYKGTWFDRILVDMYFYQSKYQDFIGGINVLQSRLSGPTAPLGLLASQTRNGYATSINSQADVTTQGYGASAEYAFGRGYVFGANFFSDEIKDVPTGFVTYFNAPKYRYNLSLGNSGLFAKRRVGFGITYRWQDSFVYEGTFGQGLVPAFNTFDAMVSYKFPAIKSIVKLGGNNIFNKYYRTAWGNPQIGGLYYVSFAYNVF